MLVSCSHRTLLAINVSIRLALEVTIPNVWIWLSREISTQGQPLSHLCC